MNIGKTKIMVGGLDFDLLTRSRKERFPAMSFRKE